MDVVISVLEPGSMADLESLDDWLRGDEELGGRVAQRRLVPEPSSEPFPDPSPDPFAKLSSEPFSGPFSEPGHVGGLTDALVVSVGAGGALTALVSMLRAWVLRPRHSHIKLRVRTERYTLEIDADRARAEDVETLVAALRVGERE